MQKNIFRKALVVGIIFLFIGIAVAPAITAEVYPDEATSTEVSDVESVNNELVEITVSICKFDEIENHTVWLTQEQANELDTLIDDFKMDLDATEDFEETIAIYCDMAESLYNLGLFPDDITPDVAQELVTGGNYESEFAGYESVFADFEGRLKNAETQEEKIAILNEVIVSMDEHGLIPEDISVEEVQQLVIDSYQNPIVMKRLEEMYSESKGTVGEDENFLCLITGQTTETLFIGPTGVIFCKILNFLTDLINWIGENYLYIILSLFAIWTIFAVLEALNIRFYSRFIPIPFGAGIIFGKSETSIPPGEEYFYPAQGWVYTNGQLGIKKWDGSFFGKILTVDYGISLFHIYVGTIGFTGVRIIQKDFYLGAALWVKLGPNPPGSSENLEGLPVMNPYTGSQNNNYN